MKRLDHQMSTKTNGLWKDEDTREKIDILQDHQVPSEIGHADLARPHVTAGLSSDPFYRAVAEKAYRYWEERGRSHGNAEADWLKAEAALKTPKR